MEQRDGKSVLNFPDATRIRDRYKTDWHRNTVKHQKTHKLFAFDCHLGYFETHAFIKLLATNSLLSLKSNTNLLHEQIPVSLFLPFCKPPLAPLAGIKFSRQLIPRCCFKCGIPTASGISSLQTATMLFLHYNASCAPIGAKWSAKGPSISKTQFHSLKSVPWHSA